MDARETGERYYRALRDRDLAAIHATLAPDCRTELPGAVLEGREAVHGWIAGFFTAFPDAVHEWDEIRVSGNVVSAGLHVRGTHTGLLVTPQGTIPATNRSIGMHAESRLVVRDGAIANLDIAFDATDFMRQLG